MKIKNILKIINDVINWLAMFYLFLIATIYTIDLVKTKTLIIGDGDNGYEVIKRSRQTIDKDCDGLIIDSIWYTVDVVLYDSDNNIYKVAVHKTNRDED